METKDYNESLRQSLIAYMTDYDLSLSDVARDIGYSSSTISKYRSGKPEGDISKLEGLLTDIIAGAATRQTRKYEIFTHHITDLVREVCDIVRGKKRASFGLLTGPAGLGKTKCLELFALSNSSSSCSNRHGRPWSNPK